MPGAYVQYSIALENTGSVDADNVVITDALAAEVTALLGQFNGGLSDIEIQPEGAASIFCTYDDTDADGCDLTGSALTIDPLGGLTIGTAAAANEVTILFQVEIL